MFKKVKNVGKTHKNIGTRSSSPLSSHQPKMSVNPTPPTSSIVFVRYTSQGSPQDRRPCTEDPQGEGSFPATEEQGFHSHPHS